VVKWDNRSLYKRLLPHMAVLTRGALRAWALGAVAVWGMRDGRGACAESEPFVARMRSAFSLLRFCRARRFDGAVWRG